VVHDPGPFTRIKAGQVLPEHIENILNLDLVSIKNVSNLRCSETALQRGSQYCQDRSDSFSPERVSGTTVWP